MKLNVDGKQQRHDFQSIPELNEYWVELTRSILEQNRLIHYVKIGEEIIYSGYESIILQNIDKISELNIVTISKQESCNETLEELIKYVPKVIQLMPGKLEVLYGDNAQDFQNILDEVIQSIYWIVNAVLFIRTLETDKSVYNPHKSEIEEFYIKLEPFVDEIAKQSEKGNYVGMADLILYEFLPILEEFQIETVDGVCENIEHH